MTVLMLSFEFPPLIVGGLGMVCYGLVKALTELGIQVNLVLPVGKACYFAMKKPQDADSLKPVFLDEPARSAGDLLLSGDALFRSLGLTRHPGLYSRGYPFDLQSVPKEWRPPWFEPTDGTAAPPVWREEAGSIFDTMEAYRDLVRRIARFAAFDIIHAHDWVTFPAAADAHDLTGKPFLPHVHSTEYDRSPSSPDPRICAIEKQGLHNADLIVAVSTFHAATIENRYGVSGKKLHVVHNGILGPSEIPQAGWFASQRYGKDSVNGIGDPVSRQRRWKRIAPEPLVLFLGRITEQKGAMHFLEVAEKVHRRVPQARFVMVGEGDKTPAVLSKAGKLGLKDRLSMTGFLSRTGVARMLSSADVLLFPSISDPFGISPLEAMSYGVAVVLSKQSGVSEVVQNVIKCDAGDIDAMASAVVDLLADPGKRRRLAKKAIREATRLGWTPAARQLKDIYQKLSGRELF